MSMVDGLVERLCEFLYGIVVFFAKHEFPKYYNEQGNYLYVNACRKDFTTFADVCFKEYGNGVQYWSTISEPNVFVVGGYDSGDFPPQRCSPPFGLANCTRGNSSTEPYIAAHHILLAHASAVRLYRKKYQVFMDL